ncbi:MAG: tRNA lysidine(34) synthetase TilS [Steroidobacteraceae bacterium]
MSEFSLNTFLPALAAIQPTGAIAGFCIALSGGSDSIVLLHVLAEVRAHNPQLQLRALHVDHQLQPQSAQWAEHCLHAAENLKIDCAVLRVTVADAHEMGVEAAARAVRYAAFKTALRPGEILLTAHHADDQLETIMLALIRGSGVDGLAAMPSCIRFGQGWHARPLLGFTHEALHDWAQARQLQYINDPSNDDVHFDRNFLRQGVVPLLKSRWPAIARTASRSASHLAEAQALLDDWTETDYLLASVDDALSVDALRELPAPRRHALLRFWLQHCDMLMPSTRVLHSLDHDMLQAAHDRVPFVQWQDAEVHRHRDLLYAEKPLADWDATVQLTWQWQQELVLPSELGCLSLFDRAVDSAESRRATDRHSVGIARAKLPAQLSVRFRDGGERIRLPGEKHHRALKKLLQESAVLPWWRECLPLIYAGDKLIAVADLWVSHEFAAKQDESAVYPVWQREQNITARA